MRKRTIVLGSAAILAAISFASCGGNSAPTTTGPASSPASVSADGGEINPTNLAPGDAIQVGDLEVRAGELKAGNSLGSTKTLCTTVGYQNTGDDIERFSLIDWKLQDPNGAALTSSVIGADNPLSTGELAAGGKTGGPVCFTDPGTKGEYHVIYTPTFSGSSDRVEWVVQR